MDMEVLRKKISTFRGDGGRVRITDDSLYMEILAAWEQWSGTSKDFYRSIGVSKCGLAGILGKAKRMRREGHFPAEPFKEVKVESTPKARTGKGGICLSWKGGHVIRFFCVDDVIEFLSKAESLPESAEARHMPSLKEAS